MATCYLCGNNIQTGQGIRKTVRMGHSKGDFITSSGTMGSGVSEHFGLQTICDSCRIAMDMEVEDGRKASRRMVLRIVIYFILGAIAVMLLGEYLSTHKN
jgi:hypothetical protein